MTPARRRKERRATIAYIALFALGAVALWMLRG